MLNGHGDAGKNNVSIVRKNLSIVDMSPNVFENSNQNNLKQFASAYTARLNELSADLIKKVEKKWGKPVVALCDLEDFKKDDYCVIIGTIYKHQQWKPSILREICEEDQLILSEPKLNYCSESDQLFLEDHTARIRLIGEKLNLDDFVTGVIAAFLGFENESSKFEVQDWCFPGCPLQTQVRTETTGKLVLLSGLNMSENYNKLTTRLLMEWLTGLSGDLTDQENNASVVQVMIAGNNVSKESKKSTEQPNFNQNTKHNIESISSLEKLDAFISELSENCCVTFMPGDGDPTSAMIPQKQLHPCLFSKSRKYESFTRATNPCVCKIGNRIVTGSSGQPIHDISKASQGRSYMHWLEQTLNWKHLSPTCLDTLPSYPHFENGDVLIMRECPDIYFAGNMEKFDTKLWKGEDNQKVRLICVPNFSTSHTAVIINLENLDVQTMTFAIGN